MYNNYQQQSQGQQQYQQQDQHNNQTYNQAQGDFNTHNMLMHLSQFAGLLSAGLGFIIPIIMWAVNKDRSKEVDRHGKNIFNFMISYFLYSIGLGLVGFIFTIGIITIPVAIVCFVLLGVLFILEFIFIIIACIKASQGEFWEYPMAIQFFYVRIWN